MSAPAEGPGTAPDGTDGARPDAVAVGGAAPVPADDAGWSRVHPASPWIRGWVIVATMLFFTLRDVGERWIGALVGAASGDDVAGPDARALLIGAGVAVAAVVLLGVGFAVSWWFTRFRLGEEQIELRQGWLFRSQRQMKYDRLQAVDLQHPLLARLLGLAAVKVEAADGDDTALELEFLPRARAAALRREILDRASGRLSGAGPADGTGQPAADGPAGGAAAPAPQAASARRGPLTPLDGEEDGELMLRVPAGRLVGAVLLSDEVLAVVVVMGVLAAGLLTTAVLVPGVVEEEGFGLGAILLGSALPVVFSLGGAVWGGLNRGWGFTVRRTDDGLRLRYGLTETTSQTVPPGRVQGVTVSQPLFWRPFGWHRVKVAVAGYGDGDPGEGRRDVALPVGPWADVLRVLEVVLPDAGLDGDPRAAAGLTPEELMRAALTGSGEEHGFRHIPRRARAWFHWFAWRRHGFTVTRTLLVVRHGRLTRQFQAVQHERLQDARLSQGPVQRRLRTATVRVHLAGGGAAAVRDLDAADARDLFELESRHAAVARRLADRDRWMEPVELARFERRLAEAARTEAGRREMAAAGVVPGGEEPDGPTTAAGGPADDDGARAAGHGEERA